MRNPDPASDGVADPMTNGAGGIAPPGFASVERTSTVPGGLTAPSGYSIYPNGPANYTPPLSRLSNPHPSGLAGFVRDGTHSQPATEGGACGRLREARPAGAVKVFSRLG